MSDYRLRACWAFWICSLLDHARRFQSVNSNTTKHSSSRAAEETPRYVEGVLWAGSISTRVLSLLSEVRVGLSPTSPLSDDSDMCCSQAPSWQQPSRAPSPLWLELDLWEELGELVGLSWTAVVSCSVCSLVSISNAAVPIRISPHFSPPLALRGMWDGGLLLTTQQVVKNARAINKRRGPMMMGGFAVGTKVPKAKAPTKVMLMPASMMHRPQAQHRAGDGRLWCRRAHSWGTFLEAGGLEVFSVSTMSHSERVWWDTEKLKLRRLSDHWTHHPRERWRRSGWNRDNVWGFRSRTCRDFPEK